MRAIIELDKAKTGSSVADYLAQRRQEVSYFASAATLLMGLLLAVLVGSWIVSVAFAVVSGIGLVLLEISNSQASRRATRQETDASLRRLEGLRWRHA